MQWQSLAQFIDMDGSGYFVWSSYGLLVILILLEIFVLRSKHKSVLKQTKIFRDINANNKTDLKNKNTNKSVATDITNEGVANES